MSGFETIEVTFDRLSDGREFVADQAIMEEPALAGFIARFSNFWTRDELRMGYTSPAMTEDA